MRDYLLHHNANTDWAYATSIETDAMIASARSALADFLNADASEIAFGNNMTTLTFHAARALGAAWGPGDEIVITDLDHHANVAPWRRWSANAASPCARSACTSARPARLGEPQERRSALARDCSRSARPRTRLARSTMWPAPAGCCTRGALVFVDAVHYAPHALVDVRAFDCDLLACSVQVLRPPHRRAVRRGGAHRGARRAEARSGARQFAGSSRDRHPESRGNRGRGRRRGFLRFARKRRHSRRAALEASFAGLHARGQALVERLWSGLSAVKGVTLYGPTPDQPRTPTVSFTLRGHTSKEIAQHLAKRAIFVSHGDFYAATIVDLLGHSADGLLRGAAPATRHPRKSSGWCRRWA